MKPATSAITMLACYCNVHVKILIYVLNYLLVVFCQQTSKTDERFFVIWHSVSYYFCQI